VNKLVKSFKTVIFQSSNTMKIKLNTLIHTVFKFYLTFVAEAWHG